MRPARRVLLVESDAGCGQALARLVRRSGDRVRLVRTPGAALAVAQREIFDLAVVDLLVQGGGVDLARRLTRRVSRVYPTVGARLLTDELLEAAIGFPVLRKREVLGLVRPSGNGRRAKPWLSSQGKRDSLPRRARKARAPAS
jgi:CheY-like chemotaxis protein